MKSLKNILIQEQIEFFNLRNDYEEVTLGEVDGNPIVLLKPKKLKKEKRVLITALAHGNEISGFPSILKLMNDEQYSSKTVDISFIPMINPTGFLLGKREDKKGLNPNRGYIRKLDPLSPEGKIIKANADILIPLASDAFLDLHEDPDEKAFYIYEYSDETLPLSKELVKIGKKYFGKLFDTGVLNSPEDNEDGSLEDYMYVKGSAFALVSEMPGKIALDKRIECTIEIIKKLIEYVEKQ